MKLLELEKKKSVEENSSPNRIQIIRKIEEKNEEGQQKEIKKIIPESIGDIEIENEELFQKEIEKPDLFKEEEKKEEPKINLLEIEEWIEIFLLVFHAWLFEKKLKKKKPNDFEKRVLPLWMRIISKYNLHLTMTEEMTLLGIYIFAIYTAEPIEEEKKEIKKKTKKEENKEVVDETIKAFEELDKLHQKTAMYYE